MTLRRVFAAAFAIAAAVAIAGVAAQPASPEFVFLNGRIFTADEGRPRAEALAVRGNRILAVGSNDDVRGLAGPSTHVFDLGGRVVVPGLNDAHTHVGARPHGSILKLRGDDPTLDDVADAIRQVATAVPTDDWIYGTIGERVLSDPNATRFTLDRLAPGRRIKLNAWTGHGLILSTPAMQALGIGDRDPDPPFGRYGRRADGVLTGLAEEYADLRANRRLTSLVPRAEIVASLRALATEGFDYGITTIQAMANAVPALELTSMFDDTHVPMRWRVIRFPVALDRDGDRASLGATVGQGTPFNRVLGVKWIVDGTPVERLSALNAPYADRPGTSGRTNFQPAQIDAILKRAVDTNEQVLLHVTGDRTTDAVLTAMERLAPASRWRQLRPRIEHGEFVSGPRIARARELGLIVVQNPAHFTIGDLMRARLGPERAATVQTMKALVDGGVAVALGGDGPLNPFLNMMFAITHPVNPGQALTPEQVIRAYTMGSAYAEFAEKEKGSLAPGKLADLAVLSADIFSVPPEKLPDTRALFTMVDGKTVVTRLPRETQLR